MIGRNNLWFMGSFRIAGRTCSNVSLRFSLSLAEVVYMCHRESLHRRFELFSSFAASLLRMSESSRCFPAIVFLEGRNRVSDSRRVVLSDIGIV